MNFENQQVWVFNGANSRFPSGVFSEKIEAEKWIRKNSLTGILTLYPLNQGVYEWAINGGFFSVKKETEMQPEFIQKFSSASQEHYHYENGLLE